MGSELSCPCGNRSSLEKEEERKDDTNIIEEVMKGKLLYQQVTYEYTYDQSKVSLIHTDDLEGFFANRNLLKLATKKEVNYYYNLYTPGLEDKSFRNNTSQSYINNSATKSKKKNSGIMDYSSSYKVEKINLVSMEKRKVMDQLANDLNLNVKKDYLFYGIVSDSEEETDKENPLNLSANVVSVNGYNTSNTPGQYGTSYNTSNSRQNPQRSFKILYKRSFLLENIDCKYTLNHFEGTLDPEAINKIINLDKNRNRILKAIMIDPICDNNLKKSYYFIFEENLSSPGKEYDYLVMEMEQGNNTNKIFLQDIATKLNDLQNPYKLSCIVSDEKKFFLVLFADLEDLELETPY